MKKWTKKVEVVIKVGPMSEGRVTDKECTFGVGGRRSRCRPSMSLLDGVRRTCHARSVELRIVMDKYTHR